jgi:hypothetical protein
MQATEIGPDHEMCDAAPPARASDFKGVIPEDWLPLAAIARAAGTKPNVLRKHRVAGWQERGMAAKDAAGNWWASPAALDTFGPATSPTSAAVPDAAVQALAALAPEGGPPPRESEGHVATAVRSLLSLRPIPWALVTKLCSMGRRYAGVAQATAQTEEAAKGGDNHNPQH